MSEKELKEIIANHKKWINNEEGGVRADLRGADLRDADLSGANLRDANLRDANLRGANLENVIGLIKIIGVEQGNYYWKRFNYIKTSSGIIKLCNNRHIFNVGINELKNGEIFADDERVLCSYPGFHFASRSWCNFHYAERKYEAKIKIPKDAKINEPWATDGKASADKISIVQVFDTETGKDVTAYFRKHKND